MTTVKNVSAGARYFYPNAEEGKSGGSAVSLDPGQEWEGEISEAAMKSLEESNVAGKPAEFMIDGACGESIPPPEAEAEAPVAPEGDPSVQPIEGEEGGSDASTQPEPTHRSRSRRTREEQ